MTPVLPYVGGPYDGKWLPADNVFHYCAAVPLEDVEHVGFSRLPVRYRRSQAGADAMVYEDVPEAIVIDYTNHRGERRLRLVIPQMELYFGECQFHPGEPPQYYLDTLDVEKGEMRRFALKDIHSWRPFVNTYQWRPF